MDETSIQRFYDQLAEDYYLIYPNWDTSIVRQAGVLDRLIRDQHGPDPQAILDCACRIGTQALGLAALGHRIVGTDLSSVAAARAFHEAATRQLRLPVAAADMCALPFQGGSFDVIVCADNSLPHLLTPDDVHAGLTEMRRVLTPDGLLIITTRDYDGIRQHRPRSLPPHISDTATGRAITFQLWEWHTDAEHYDVEHFQLVSQAGSWQVNVRRATYWALTREQLTRFVIDGGFDQPV